MPPAIRVPTRPALQTWASIQLSHALATSPKAFDDNDVHLVPLLMFVQRLARLLKTYSSGQELSLDIIFHALVLEFGSHPDWLMMLSMAFEMRAIVLVLDGIDEAAGRRDDIQKLVLNVLATMGQRVVTTSRPEGVDLSRFKETLVIVGLQPLDENQAQQAINQQMQMQSTGRELSKNLLDFQRIRKGHDQIWMHEAFESDEMRERVEALASPDRFRLADPPEDAHRDVDGKAYDAEMRQHCADGTRVIQRREGEVKSTYWKQLNRQLEPVLAGLDGVVERCTTEVSTEEIERAVDQVLRRGSETSPSGVLQTVASRLCLVARDEKTLPSLLVEIIRDRTDELYEAVEALLPTLRVVMAAVLRKAGLDPGKVVAKLDSGEEIKALTLAPGLKDPVNCRV